MARFRLGRTVCYRRLRALVAHGLLSRQRVVHGQPALYTATRNGLTWAGIPQLEPARVGVATMRHWATCARLAVQLERTERVDVWGEPRLRAAELEADHAVASAHLEHCRTAGRGYGGRISCCFPMRRCRWRSRSSCRSRDPAGLRRSAALGRAAGSSARSATTGRRTSRVPFPAPSPPSARTTPSESCRSMKPSRRGLMSGSPLDPMVHMLTTLALAIGGAALATLSTVMFLRWLGLHWTWTLPGVLLGPVLWPFDQEAAGLIAGTAVFATATGARWHLTPCATAPTAPRPPATAAPRSTPAASACSAATS